MDVERRPASRLDRLSTQARLAPLTLRMFALVFVLAELVALVASPSPLRGVGVILSIAAVFGILAAIWVVWFGVGVILLISIVVDAVSGQPWYEIAWALVALTLLCWPSSWAYINSGGVVEGSPSAEK
jgi:hypothetical protein